MSIKIQSKDLSDLVELFTDQYGIDFERMHKFLLKIQSNSNFDYAKVKRMEIQTVKESDEGLLQRIANLFQTEIVYFHANFENFKSKLTERCEKHRSIMLSSREITKLIEMSSIPLYGAVLNAIFERASHNNLIK